MTNHDAGAPSIGAADPADFGDADLVLRTRSGDTAAFGELWRRHYRSGMTVARSVTSSLDPDDLVQEAYTRIYQSIVSGGGPTGSFRAYLFTSIRNTAAAWGRARRETAIDALDTVEDPSSSEEATSDALDRSLTHQAFRSLPTRWQEVLWYSEIEGMKPAEIAPLLGMKATAVAQLTFRAREGLREAWIQAHLRSVADGSDCQWTIEHLGAYSRLNLGRRDRGRIEGHLATCARCAIVASEAKEVSSRLALVLLPLTVGAVGTAGYLATLQGGGVPAVALAAMPSTVMPGVVTILPAVPGATVAAGTASAGAAGAAGAGAAGSVAAGSVGATAGAVGTAAATAGVAGASAAAAGAVSAGAVASAATTAAAVTAGGILSSIGAMTGLAAASLVVFGSVVAASVVLPNVGGAQNAADTTNTSIVQQATEQVADSSAKEAATGTTADAPPVSTDDAAATTPDSATSDPAVADPAVADAAATALQSQSAQSQAPQSQAPQGNGQPAIGQQGKPAEPVQAGNGQPATGEPAQQGNGQQGGTTTPGQPADPGSQANPGNGVGPTNPNAVDRGPDLPTGAPAIAASTSYTSPDTGQVVVEVTVTGAPGATVQARIRGVVHATAVLDAAGSAIITLQPSQQELRGATRLELRYVNGDHMGVPVDARLSDLL